MIDINLIIKPPPRLRWPVVLTTVAFAALAAAAALHGFAGLSQLHRLRTEEAALRSLSAAYREQGSALPSVQKELSDIEAFLEGAAQLGRNQRFSQADVLEAVWARPEGVRLTSIVFEGATVTLSGEAGQFAAANQYLLDLRALPIAAAVEEVSATKWADGSTSFTYRLYLRKEAEAP